MVNNESAAVATSAPYSAVWNTYYVYNGATQSVYAIALDSTGATLSTTPPVTFTVANPLPQPTTQLSCSYTVPASAWSGSVSITVNCTGTNVAHHKTFLTYIDGTQVASSAGNTSASYTLVLNTTNYFNGSRNFVMIVADNDTGQPSAAPGDFSQVSEYEALVTLSNGSAPIVELRADATDVFLNLSSTTTHQIAINAIHADSSVTTPAAGYASNKPSIASVTAGGLITALALGTAQITVTSGALTKVVWVNVLADLTKFYHFGKDGTILGVYTPANSMLFNSMFFSFNGLNDPNYSQAQFASDYKNGGWNLLEVGITGAGPVPTVGQTQNAFQTALSSYMAPFTTFANTYGLKIHLLGDNLVRQNNYAYMTSRGPGAAFTPQTAVQYTYAQWQATGLVVGVSGDDEVDGAIGCCPQLGQIKMGVNGLTQIVAAGGTCTASLSAPGEWLGAGDNPRKFVIDGSVTANMNSTAGVVYTSTSQNSTTTVFSCAGVPDGTYNSSNDPNLTLEQYADQWYTAAGAVSANPATAVDYARYNQMTSILTQVNGVSPRPMIGWPPGGNPTPDTVAAPYNTLGNWSAYGDYSEVYTTYSLTQSNYLPTAYPLQVLAISVGSTYRKAFSVINQAAPFLCEPTTTNVDYGFQGNSIPVTSFVGNLITFGAPHGINTVLDGDTRLTLSGQSTSGDNGNYWVSDCPTATTCHVYGGTTFTASSFSGTLHYQSGASYAAYQVSQTSGAVNFMTASLTTTVDPACASYNHRGQTVTVSGTGLAFDTTTYYATFNSPVAGCGSPHNLNLWQISTGSSTGGAATITPDNNYIRGRNIPSPSGNEIGPRFMFANYSECLIVGAAGARDYVMYSDENSFNAATGQYSAGVVADNTVFNDAHASNQEGAHPHWNNGPNNVSSGHAVRSFEAPSGAVRLYNRLAKFLLQPRQNSPDYGPLFDASLRSGSNGRLLLVQSLTEGVYTRTVDLTNCVVSGQATIKYYATWQGITITMIGAGTASDTLTFDPGGLAAYVCSNNAAAEYSPPIVSARLADVPNAASVLVRYNYAPWLLRYETINALNCGTGSCTVPVDRQIGTVYYQLIYIDGAGRVLATSDVQTL
jgi:hypothetical protein